MLRFGLLHQIYKTFSDLEYYKVLMQNLIHICQVIVSPNPHLKLMNQLQKRFIGIQLLASHSLYFLKISIFVELSLSHFQRLTISDGSFTIFLGCPLMGNCELLDVQNHEEKFKLLGRQTLRAEF